MSLNVRLHVREQMVQDPLQNEGSFAGGKSRDGTCGSGKQQCRVHAETKQCRSIFSCSVVFVSLGYDSHGKQRHHAHTHAHTHT